MECNTVQFDSFRLITIKNENFKSCHMEINFVNDALKVNMPLRTFLINIMGYTTKKYPTRRDVLIALEELYNSDFTVSVNKYGKCLHSSFGFDFISPKYINDKNYLENCVKFLCDSILNPNINNNQFDEISVSIKKESFHRRIDSYKERALDYALKESRDFLFANSFSSKTVLGTHEDIDAITNEDLLNDYKKLWEDSQVDILVIGNLDMDLIAKYFKEYFQKETIVEDTYDYFVDNPISPYQELEVPSKYVQTQLLMYLQYDNITKFEEQVVYKVYCQILGNANQSDKLATYLRIENPLVYARGCTINLSNHYLLIYTSLNYKNVPQAIKGINRALKEMENGEIDEEYFELQKEKIISNITMSEDNPGYILDNYYFHILLGDLLIEEEKEELKKVTIDDVKKFAKKLKKSLVYILKEADKDERN